MRFDTPLADRVTASILFALGIAMLIGGYQMDRLEIRQIHPASIPGLVPMMLGAALGLCAMLLFAASRRPAAVAAPALPDDPPTHSWRNMLITAVWSVIYAVGLVGWLPYALATALYVAGFVFWCAIADAPSRPDKVKAAVAAVLFAAVVALAVSALFRYAFLVRLP